MHLLSYSLCIPLVRISSERCTTIKLPTVGYDGLEYKPVCEIIWALSLQRMRPVIRCSNYDVYTLLLFGQTESR